MNNNYEIAHKRLAIRFANGQVLVTRQYIKRDATVYAKNLTDPNGRTMTVLDTYGRTIHINPAQVCYVTLEDTEDV